MHARTLILPVSTLLFVSTVHAQSKPPITLDEFMNATEIASARISPDGTAAVVATDAPDWQQNRFRDDLWIWTEKTGTLQPLTHSGHDRSPAWSPDGKYIAFLADRPTGGDADSGDSGRDDNDKDGTDRVWVIPVSGGEAFPLYTEKLQAHAFAWSTDGATIYFSAQEPLSKDAEEKQKADWKDVVRWREQERGDVLLSIPLSAAIARNANAPAAHEEPSKSADDKPLLPQNAKTVTHSHLEIGEIVVEPNGSRLAFETGPPSHRLEDPGNAEVFLVASAGGDAKQLTRNQALETNLQWSPDGKHLYFFVHGGAGFAEGAYQDVQGRLYQLDPESGKATRLGGEFQGSWEDYTVTAAGKLVACGLTGVEQQLYRIDGPSFTKLTDQPGNYGGVHAALHGEALLYTHSTINDPTQVFLSSDAHPRDAKPLTSFNSIFKERAQVEWQPYSWKSDDGTTVQGVLIYPPGKKGEKHLPMFTLIHGGPEDADGNRFGANWYDWATLAAVKGWLVFRPNYRGSTGYGDKFMLEIAPHIVSLPGRDILTGVDALVKDGIADPDHLTVGGYSYGGYMTDWLITQTTRFKAAVTGAGAIENAANWGNDDLTADDAWYLSGTPWEKPEIYQREAALFQINKVKTPTHLVGGQSDVRVSYFEDVLLESALQKLNVPHAFLAFPGEGHSLDKNPWHGYIKVREELKWLEKYDPPKP
jgi:dipeptidyl aminopeptidase/acylaminoacyl peptidase